MYSSFESIQTVPFHHFTGEKGIDPFSGNIHSFHPSTPSPKKPGNRRIPEDGSI
jgi:hypothetical protein